VIIGVAADPAEQGTSFSTLPPLYEKLGYPYAKVAPVCSEFEFLG
jgi:hypothetical protein